MLVATAELVLFTVLLVDAVGDGLADTGDGEGEVGTVAVGDGLAETGDGEGELGGGGEAAAGEARLASATADCCRVRSDDTGNASPKIRQETRLSIVCSQKKGAPSGAKRIPVLKV